MNKPQNTPEEKAMFFDEIWKDIEGYEGVYQVSDKGNVRRFKPYLNKFLNIKPYNDISGYLKVGLCLNYKRKMCMVHRLVAKAFITNNILNEVNHINGIKTDNRVENLEWITRGGNIRHAINNGLKIGINKRDEKGRIAKGNQS